VIISVDAMVKHINDVYNEYPANYSLDTITSCNKYKRSENCTTIGYGILGEEKEWVNATMQHVAYKYGLTFGHGNDVAKQWNGSNSTKYLEYLGNNSNQTQIGVLFCTSTWIIFGKEFNCT
jgi:hypothetical protein